MKTAVMVSPHGLTPEQGKEVKDRSEMAVLEENDIAFDPSTQHVDLTKDEKRRTTALMLAIQAYQNLIIKDADYLREADNIARRDGASIRPATMNAMVDAAISFDLFIAGHFAIPDPATATEETPSPVSDESGEQAG